MGHRTEADFPLDSVGAPARALAERTVDDDPAALRPWLRLAYSEGIGPVRGAALLAGFGGPAAVLQAAPAAIAAALGSARLAAALLGADRGRDAAIDAALAWRAAADDRRLLVLGDPAYPATLRHLADPPLVLHAEGRIEALGQPQVAIVGSRNASANGLSTAHALARRLAGHGYVIASGLAEGIDAAAHAGALAGGGLTVAVLGTGIDRVYPPWHAGLAARIRRAGVLVSEFAPGSAALPGHFPRRNRLIAALSRAVVVVEAALRSGSLITAAHALDLGRDVLAVPGSVHSPLARGCHRLLRDGAGLVENADDVLAAVGPAAGRAVAGPAVASPAVAGSALAGAPSGPGSQATAVPAAAPAAGDDPPEVGRLLALLSADPVHVDRLAAHLDRPVGHVLGIAQTLELDGRARRLDDGRFIRI